MKQTWHIHIKGQVQGVGFRPFVYQKAQEFDLNGWVNNTTDGVHCEFNSGQNMARMFYESLVEDAPVFSDITGHELWETDQKKFDEFRIVDSESKGQPNLLLTPDFAMCEDCRDELFTPDNRRQGYPFITCTNCGPRYSIIEKLPYDRETTTMEKFLMCELCRAEYENPLDRRYYSQTNSCGTCGISMSLYDANQKRITSDSDEIISKITSLLSKGKIVAMKGIGGYLLTCDAANAKAIKNLRERKERPAKPFALMYPDMATLGKDVILGEEEKQVLANAVSPIVLAEVRKEPTSATRLHEIAPGLSRLGVMIPYTPLYALLMESFGRPIVATSGNITNSSIIYDDEKALSELIHIADYVLTNNREIIVPQDDSVVVFTSSHRKKIIYRRSRGMAPSYINPKLKLPKKTVLAAGADLKSTFTYLHRKNIFIGQYLGGLDHFDTEQNYRHTVAHFFELFGERPQVVLADEHSDYFSSRFAEQLGNEINVPVKKYQHHRAHFGAVLGEHALLYTDEPILGIIWDGTGLGDDGNIWGGEFFRYERHAFSRCGHFDYFDFIVGDNMPREPRISAMAATHGIKGAKTILKGKFSDMEWNNYQILLQKTNNLKTSSVGRLFDAVSSLLGIIDRSNYEGQAAMLLEDMARQHVNKNGLPGLKNYEYGSVTEAISGRELLQEIIRDIENGVSTEMIAARFHYSLVDIIRVKAEKEEVSKIAFSGGVFQNALLVDMIIEELAGKYGLYFHKKISPNDENISFGQLMCYMISLRNEH